jgi:hypothetical protein
MPQNLPVSCAADGDDYTFTLRARDGDRTFAARVTDANGNQTVTDQRTIHVSVTPKADDSGG